MNSQLMTKAQSKPRFFQFLSGPWEQANGQKDTEDKWGTGNQDDQWAFFCEVHVEPCDTVGLDGRERYQEKDANITRDDDAQ